MNEDSSKIKTLLEKYGFNEKVTSLEFLSFFEEFTARHKDHNNSTDFMNRVFGMMNDMAQDYELFLCAAAIEKEIQMSIIRSINETRNHDAIISIQDNYQILDSPIGKKAFLFNGKLTSDLANQESDKSDLSSLNYLKAHFKNYTYTTTKPAMSSTYNVFSSFNNMLDNYINHTSYNQSNFISLYYKSEETFKNQEKVLVRSVGLDYIKKNRQFKDLGAGKIKICGSGFREEYFNPRKIIHRIKNDLSWIVPRDLPLFSALSKRSRSFDEMSKFGIDVNEMIRIASSDIEKRKLSPTSTKNYIVGMSHLIENCEDDVRNQVYKISVKILSRIKYSSKTFDHNVINMAISINKDTSIPALDRFGATLYLYYAGVIHDSVTLSSTEDIKEACEMIRETAPDLSTELKTYLHFGFDKSEDLSIRNNNRISKIKRASISEDLGI